MKPLPFAGLFAAVDAADSASLALLGIADDRQSSFLAGCAEAPERILAAYDGRCYNSTAECGMDVAEMVANRGILRPRADWTADAARYGSAVQEILSAGQVPFIFGGDHAVTVPVVAALEALGEPIHVIQIDAHPDCYFEYDGDPASHACTGLRLLEMAHVKSLTQIGIRAANAAQDQAAAPFADKLHRFFAADLVQELPPLLHLTAADRVYLTLDLDGLDPAFAPGVSHPVPGGLSPRQILNLLQNLPGRLVGMDIVEYNPRRDVNDLTAIVAGRLMHEAMGAFLLRIEAGGGRCPR